MARTPAPAPAAPAAAPAAPTRRRRPRPTTGEMNFELRQLPKPLRLRQVARDPAWDKFKTVMVIIGGIGVFVIYGVLVHLFGGGSIGSVPESRVIERVVHVPARPASAATPRPAPAPPPAPSGPCDNLSPAERSRCEKWVLRK